MTIINNDNKMARKSGSMLTRTSGSGHKPEPRKCRSVSQKVGSGADGDERAATG